MSPTEPFDLQGLYDSLPTPRGGRTIEELAAVQVPGHEGHRIGRDSQGCPLLLLETSDQPSSHRLPPIRLEHLSVQHDLLCRVSSPNRAADTADHTRFTVVRCADADLTSYFLRVGTSIITALGPNPSRNKVSEVVGRLAELFQAMSRPPRGSVQGLWAELLIIAKSRDAQVMVEAWRIEPEDRFDFSRGDQRLEVKSASGHERRHHFALEQVRPPENVEALIASVFVERAGGGCSLSTLIDRVQARLRGDPDLALYVDQVVSTTLGTALRRGLEDRFDLQRAEATLAFYRAEDVPSVSPDLPPTISGVRFSADLTEVAPIDLSACRRPGTLLDVLP